MRRKEEKIWLSRWGLQSRRIICMPVQVNKQSSLWQSLLLDTKEIPIAVGRRIPSSNIPCSSYVQGQNKEYLHTKSTLQMFLLLYLPDIPATTLYPTKHTGSYTPVYTRLLFWQSPQLHLYFSGLAFFSLAYQEGQLRLPEPSWKRMWHSLLCSGTARVLVCLTHDTVVNDLRTEMLFHGHCCLGS